VVLWAPEISPPQALEQNLDLEKAHEHERPNERARRPV
jgi:hypothetical protein